MHWFSILLRELKIAARRKATHRHRLMVGLAVVGVAVVFSMFFPIDATSAGRSLFEVLAWGGFIFCLFEGIRETSDSLAQERREGTLGLLFLTELRGLDVVLGKLSAAAIKTFSTFLVMMPVFALPIWMGGVTGGEFSRVTLAIIAGLSLALSAGMLASTVSVGSFTALAKAFLFVLAAIFLPAGVMMLWTGPSAIFGNADWSTGPLAMFLNAREARFAFGAGTFWTAACHTAVLCGLLLVLAGRAAARSWRQDENLNTEAFWQRWLRPQAGYTDAWAGASADPSVWIAEKTLLGRRMLWVVIVFGLIASPLIGGFMGREAGAFLMAIQIGYGFLLKLWLAAVAPQSLNAARRTGALELLLCTPVSHLNLIRGQMDTLVGYFLPPALVVSVGLPMAGLFGVAASEVNYQGGGELTGVVMFGVFWLILFFLDVYAVGYTGLWLGLTEPQAQRAVAKTIFRVLLLPWLTVLIPCAGFLGMLGWPIFWIWWSSRKLNLRFREEAARPLSAG